MPSDFCTRQHHSVALRSFLEFEKVSEGSDGPITVMSDSLQQFLLCRAAIPHMSYAVGFSGWLLGSLGTAPLPFLLRHSFRCAFHPFFDIHCVHM
ncbi:hypothetical protein, unlikely [Trypanosoma brucei brucei TREU927]|uniref:Uncharacterized protein n=1 Tax=Trypanosoma brucei brucei (strain 927/4 GUTat10.1) TaxID=185431 RepID=Q8IFH2_TRYB2|nr:hypothetical protein, unlikely [Trypanosoma brucei brucei TREU927]CAD53040.1 hypothetical protein, unlikely [Trypanosoma brucei brucei TREU927]